MATRAEYRWRSVKRLAVAAISMISFASCSDYRDAVVFNGCDEKVTVSFGASASDEGSDATTVAVGEGVTVPRVIADTGGSVTVRVENGSGDSLLLDIHVTDDGGVIPIGILPPDCPE
ncbi:MAG: hypothetical protein OEV60_08855 [Actinomycetota bacterium]|nr:hypothetical protein [Actinomycetota bacterium]MDH5223929.1 hypothetical protein [Actinomycetota bacterium]